MVDFSSEASVRAWSNRVRVSANWSCESFSGFFITCSLCAGAAALKIGGHHDACDKGSGGRKKEGDDSRKHGHLLF